MKEQERCLRQGKWKMVNGEWERAKSKSEEQLPTEGLAPWLFMGLVGLERCLWQSKW